MNIEAYSVDYRSPDFNKKVENFVRKKKFKKLPAQILDFIVEVEKGNFSGDIIEHSNEPPYDVYKARLPNEDVNVGKSNGYRLIYIAKHDNRIIAFLCIYYKKEDETVTDTYVKGLIDGYFLTTIKEEADTE